MWFPRRTSRLLQSLLSFDLVMLYRSQLFMHRQAWHSLWRCCSMLRFIMNIQILRFKHEHFMRWFEFTINRFMKQKHDRFRCHKDPRLRPQYDQKFPLEYIVKFCRPHWTKTLIVIVRLRRHLVDMVQIHEQRSNNHPKRPSTLRSHVSKLFNCRQSFQASTIAETHFKILHLVMLSLELWLQVTKSVHKFPQIRCF